MLNNSFNEIIEVLMWISGIFIIILMGLEMYSLKNDPKPPKYKRDWSKKDEDDDF